MPPRHRHLLPSRFFTAPKALWIQLKRAGLALRRIWTGSPDDEPVGPRIAHFNDSDAGEDAAPSGRLSRLAASSWRSLSRTARISTITIRRAGLRARQSLKKQTAWTLAGVTGTLGVVLMLILQLIYSFQTLKAKETTPAEPMPQRTANTRIDPGFPQVRPLESEESAFAQIDPFAPALPNPDQTPPAEPDEPFVDPLDNLPPSEPIPAEPERFVDPLDNLPPSEPIPPPEPIGDPFSPIPDLPEEPDVPPMPIPESDPPLSPIPEADPEPPVSEQWVAPLDNLPPLEPERIEPQAEPNVPTEPLPEPSPMEPTPDPGPNPFVDPLDNQPPLEPEPSTDNEVELGMDFLRLPADQEEQFVLESVVEFRRRDQSQDLQSDAWDAYRDDRQEPRRLRSYWDRLSPEDKQRIERDLVPVVTSDNEEPGEERSVGDLAIAVMKDLPPEIQAFEPQRYQIVIENRGAEMIESVDVDEAVPPTHELTDASPAGHFENNLLRWRLKDIRPGEERRLEVEVVPSEPGTIETATAIRPSTRVASLTEVSKSSAIRLRRAGYRNISLNEPVLFTNHVENLSETTQRDVVIEEQVPEGYRVVRVEDAGVYNRETRKITWKLAELAGGKTAKLHLHLQAETPGELVSRVKCSSSEGPAVPILARVNAGPIETRRPPASGIPPVSLQFSSANCPACPVPYRFVSWRIR